MSRCIPKVEHTVTVYCVKWLLGYPDHLIIGLKIMDEIVSKFNVKIVEMVAIGDTIPKCF
jgi:hypothetical protein